MPAQPEIQKYETGLWYSQIVVLQTSPNAGPSRFDIPCPAHPAAIW